MSLWERFKVRFIRLFNKDFTRTVHEWTPIIITMPVDGRFYVKQEDGTLEPEKIYIKRKGVYCKKCFHLLNLSPESAAEYVRKRPKKPMFSPSWRYCEEAELNDDMMKLDPDDIVHQVFQSAFGPYFDEEDA